MLLNPQNERTVDLKVKTAYTAERVSQIKQTNKNPGQIRSMHHKIMR